MVTDDMPCFKTIVKFVNHSITYSLRLQNAAAVACFRVFPTQSSPTFTSCVMRGMTVIDILHKPGVAVAHPLFPLHYCVHRAA